MTCSKETVISSPTNSGKKSKQPVKIAKKPTVFTQTAQKPVQNSKSGPESGPPDSPISFLNLVDDAQLLVKQGIIP